MGNMQSEIDFAPSSKEQDRWELPVVMKMMTNDSTVEPSLDGNGLGVRPREPRVTPLRHPG